MTRTVAIYARFSSDLQTETSIDDQIALCRKHAAREGWQVVQTYADAAMSGRTANRPELQRMLSDAKTSAFDTILVENVNRFGRRVVDNLQSHELLAFTGVKLISVHEGEQDFLKMLLNSLGAQMFSEKIGEATRRGQAGALTRNRLHGVPYGYRKIDADTGLNREIDPAQAAIVRRIFEEAAGGKSGDAIARDLNRDGVPGPYGGDWYASTIRGGGKLGNGILRKEIYTGRVTYGRTEVKRAPDGSKRRRRGDPERMTVQDIPELRIVEQEVWDRVQDRLRKSAEKTKGRNPRAAARKKYLLSGLLECACCGQPYIMISTSSGGLYGCRGKRNGTCSNAQTIRRTRIEERVFAALTPAMLSPEMEAAYQAATEAERAKAKPQETEAELKALRKAIKREEKARAAIFKAIEDGAPYAAFKARAEAIEASLTALQERYATAEADQRAASQTPPNVARSLSEALRVMHELLSDPDLVHEAHTLLATLISRIRLTPDELAPHGIAAEIQTDLGRFLLAGGQTHQTAPILAIASLLTVKHGPMAHQ